MMITDSILALLNKALRTEVEGLEKLDFSTPSILIPNHTSLIDAAILIEKLPKDACFVVNTGIAKRFARILKGRNILTVDPLNPYSVKKMVKGVKSGKVFVIFPEGRITRTGGLMKIYPGVGYIAMKTGAKLYPITIDGLDRSKFSYLNDKTKTVLFPKVKVKIGDAFTISKKENVSMKKQKKDAAKLILEKLQQGRFEIQQKENINLFNEFIDAAKKYGLTTKISEDLSGEAKYKDLLLNTYVLSNKFENLLKNEKNVGVLMPNTNAHAVILFSLFRIGKTPAILNFSVGKQTIQDSVETAGYKTVITSQKFIDQGKLYELIEGLKEKKVRILYLDKMAPSVLTEDILSFAKDKKELSIFMPESESRIRIASHFLKENIPYTFLNKLKEEDVEKGKINAIITTKRHMGQKGLEEVASLVEEKKIPVYYFEEKDDVKITDERKKKLETVISESRVGETNEIYHSISSSEKIAGYLDYKKKKKSKFLNNELVLFTSGSESKPKGVVLSHENIYHNVYQARSIIDFTSKDKILNALPMFHSFGLTAGTFLPLLLGVRVFLFPSPLRYKEVPMISYDRMATIIFGTSTFLSGYGRNADPTDFFSMRYVFAGAEKLKSEVKELWMEEFGIRILEGYGITETAPILSLNTPLAYKKDTVGRFLPGIEYKLEPVDGIESGGNLLVKGPNIMKGYLLHEKGFVPKDEWYDTGDIVDVDEEGFITIKSRLKRFAKIGGEMISLNLVEEIATQCFEHEGVATVNIPDPRKGEQIVLFSTKKDVSKEKIREFITLNGHSSLMNPSKILYIDKLPLLGSGKTNYVELKKIAENQ